MKVRRYLLPLALACALLVLALPASAGAYIYWGVYSGGSSGAIGRANNDGSEANPNFIPGAEATAPLALDSSHLYYTTNEEDEMGGPAVVRTNLDGGEATPLPEGLLFSSIGGVSAVDAGHIYYVDSSGIGRAGLAGEDPEPEFLPVVGQFGGIAIYNSFIYWTNYEGGFGESIGRANLSTKVVDPEFVEFETPEAAGPHAIAVSAEGIFWTMNPAFDGSFAGNIGFAGLGGGTPVLDEIPGAIAAPASGIAIDGSDLYWCDFKEGSGTSLVRAELQGSGSTIQRLPIPALGSVAVSSAGSQLPPPGPPAPPPPPPPGGSTPPGGSSLAALKLAKLKLNPKNGTATLVVAVPGPGKLALGGAGLLAVKKKVAKAGNVSLTVKPTKATQATLRKSGKKKVTAKITFTPTTGARLTASKPVTLKLD